MRPAPGRRAALGALALLAVCPAAFAQSDDRPSIAAAMRLAVLVERVAKLQLQLAQGVMAERGTRAVTEARREFDAGLRALSTRLPGPEVRDNYLLLRILWDDFRPLSTKPPTRESARSFGDRVDEAAWIAGKGARMLHPGGADSLAMRAWRVCVLSQRIPRLALMRRWDARSDEIARDLASALGEMRALLEQLATAPLNTPETAGEVRVAQTQFGFLERAAGDLDRGGARAADNVVKTGDHILEVMGRVAPLYESAGS